MTSEYLSYPPTPNIRSGCKVGWRYYDREIDAKECARAAIHNARIKEALGYDFGYCAPGHIEKVTSNVDKLRDGMKPFAGKYEVCIP